MGMPMNTVVSDGPNVINWMWKAPRLWNPTHDTTIHRVRRAVV